MLSQGLGLLDAFSHCYFSVLETEDFDFFLIFWEVRVAYQSIWFALSLAIALSMSTTGEPHTLVVSPSSNIPF